MPNNVKITRVAQTKRGRFSLYTDEGFLFSMHPEVFALSGLSEGAEIDIEALESLRCESELKIAKEKALNLLGHSSRTKQQLYDRLLRHADELAADAAVQRMEELGLVNDADYARRFAADMLHLKGWAPRRIAQELRRKGVEPEIIEDCLAQLQEEFDPVEKILQVVQRKYRGALADQKSHDRAVAALIRLGYQYEDIRSAFRRLQEE